MSREQPARHGCADDASAEALAREHDANRVWNSTTKERSFTYRKTYSGLTNGKAAACTVTRTVVYADASAVLVRTQLAARLSTCRRLAVGARL